MKWIGQNIQDYISRFRSDVYFENGFTSNSDIVIYDATNDGNPTISIGSSASERLEITATYESGAQGLDKVVFKTYTAGSSTDDGMFTFSVDESHVLSIRDAGIRIAPSKSLRIGDIDILTDSSGTTTLNNIDALDATTIATFETAMEANLDTFGSQMTSASSLATIGTITTGVWNGTAIASAYLDADTAHLSGTQTFTGAKTFSGGIAGPIEIEQGASGGGSALLIDNDDVDQQALEINAANTTASIAKIVAPDLTSGNAIYVNCDSLTTGKALRLDVDDALTATATKILLDVDYDKAGVTASGQTSTTTGVSVNMADAATNNAGGRVTMIGAQFDVDSANAQGTITQKGLILNVAADGVGDELNTSGIEMEVVDGGTDIKMMSHADTADYCTIATTTNGATTITTVDDGAAAAHFEVAADGDITLDAAGTIKLEGPVRPTGQIQVTHHMIKDDIGTGVIYISLGEIDAESGTKSNKNLPLLAPVDGKLLRVFLRTGEDMSESGHDTNLTWRLLTRASSATTDGNSAVIGTQTGAGPTASSMATYDFTSSLDSGTNAIAAGDKVQLSVQSDATSADQLFFITCLWEWDLS